MIILRPLLDASRAGFIGIGIVPGKIESEEIDEMRKANTNDLIKANVIA